MIDSFKKNNTKKQKIKSIFIFVFLCFLFFSSIVFSHVVCESEIKKKAQNFLDRKNYAFASILSKQNIKKIFKIEALTYPNNNEVLAYIVNIEPKGFMIISTDTNIEPIIAYSFRHNWSAKENTAFYQVLLLDLKLRKTGLLALPANVMKRNNQKWQKGFFAENTNRQIYSFQQWPEEGTTTTGGWIETTWTQSSPYNDYCPIDPETKNRNLVGCVGTATAQIVNYHKFIKNLYLGEDEKYDTEDLNIQIDADSARLNFPSFKTLNSILEQIKYNYANSRELTNSEKAALNFICTILLETNFTYPNSGARVSSATNVYKNKFGYDSADFLYPGETFYHILKANMKNGFPAQLSILKSSGAVKSSHCVVADGYNSDGFYHLNFGWGNANPGQITDAWYLIPEQMPAYYNILTSSILNIKPVAGIRAQLEASENSLYFSPCRVGGCSDIQNIVLKNIGKNSVEIDHIISTDYFYFRTTTKDFVDSLGSLSIPVGDELNLNVVCQPDSIGVFTGNIIASFSTETEFLTIHLVGHGIPVGGTSIIEENVSGNWYQAGAPYYICQNIKIAEGDKLEIAPGTEVIFTGSYKFEIGADAQLIAKGTETDSIYFFAFDIDKKWLGLDFKNSGVDDTLSYCVITNGQKDGKGGAISISYSSPVIYHSKILKNKASYGGAIAIYKSHAKLSNLMLSENNADSDGGAFYIDESSPIISNATVFKNEAKNGGAFYLYCSLAKISNSVIFKNKADNGGAICGYKSSPLLKNVTITQNEALSFGGALNLSGFNFFKIKNSILWANKADSGATLSFRQYYPKPDSIEFNYSNIDTSSAGWIFREQESYDNRKIFQWFGNICADPLFYNPDQENFTLQLGSPCIDGGDPNEDFGEEPFPHGYCINMGAYGGTVKAATTTHAVLTFVPNPLDFDILKVKGTKAKICYLKNGSPLSIHINEITLSDSANFSISGFSQNGDLADLKLTLEPGEIDSIKVQFSPTQNIEQEYVAYILINMDECSDKKIEIRAQTSEYDPYQNWEPIPRKPELAQNYPNPFNSETAIEYRMHRDDYVAIKIYNLLGKEIRTLEKKNARAGLNRVIWDGKDNEGKTVVSGLYFYQMRTGYYRRLKKMIFVK